MAAALGYKSLSATRGAPRNPSYLKKGKAAWVVKKNPFGSGHSFQGLGASRSSPSRINGHLQQTAQSVEAQLFCATRSHV